MTLSEEDIKKKECFLMYFLIQSFASAFLLVCLFSWTTIVKSMQLENFNNNITLIVLLICLKIAIGPLHFWLIKISKFISWFIIGILLTWQKIIPLSFLSTFSINFFIGRICIVSIIIGTLRQLNLTSLKMLIAFSSVGHLGWILYPLLSHSMATLFYLFIYSLIITPMINMFICINYKYLFNQINYKVIRQLFLLILSLSGIPPLLGFIIKWISLTLICSSILVITIFSIMGCLRFYIYIQITYKRFLLTPFSLNKNTTKINLKWIWIMNFILPITYISW